MQIGFDARSPTLAAGNEQLVRVITEGEQMGFDYTTISDHLISPKTVTARWFDDSTAGQGVNTTISLK